jgi:hypothetical protein
MCSLIKISKPDECNKPKLSTPKMTIIWLQICIPLLNHAKNCITGRNHVSVRTPDKNSILGLSLVFLKWNFDRTQYVTS